MMARMPTYAVEYEYDDRSAERDRVRPEHRAFLRGLHDDGALLASGPWTGPDATPGALLLVRAASADEALGTLDADPFVRAGLVTGRSAREWDPVIGPWGD